MTPIEGVLTRAALPLNKELNLSEAFSAIDASPDIEATVVQLRNLIGVTHLVYHSSKLGVSPSVDPYIRLTYPSAWIKRYLLRGYVHIDPVLREGFQRSLPFDWSELKITTPEEFELLKDALDHGIGPHGLSIPLRSKQGHRALFSMTSSGPREEWDAFWLVNLQDVREIGYRLHRRVISELRLQNQLVVPLGKILCASRKLFFGHAAVCPFLSEAITQAK